MIPYNVIACIRTERRKKNRKPRVHIIPVEWHYVFNILFAVKLNEDVGGSTSVIAWTSDEYV